MVSRQFRSFRPRIVCKARSNRFHRQASPKQCIIFGVHAIGYELCAFAAAWEGSWEGLRWRKSGCSRIKRIPAISVIPSSFCMQGDIETCSEDDPIQAVFVPRLLCTLIWTLNLRIFVAAWKGQRWRNSGCFRSMVNDFLAISAILPSVRMQASPIK
jgi:hypothetical protein